MDPGDSPRLKFVADVLGGMGMVVVKVAVIVMVMRMSDDGNNMRPPGTGENPLNGLLSPL
jgi:hypothetical protein